MWPDEQEELKNLFMWILFLYLSLVNKSNVENLKQKRHFKTCVLFLFLQRVVFELRTCFVIQDLACRVFEKTIFEEREKISTFIPCYMYQ